MASALAVASATPGVAQRCAPAKGDGEHLLLGLGAPADTDDDEAIDAPFAPEIGTATALKDAFAVGVLEPRGKTTNAGLLVVGGSLSVGKKIDLGAVHGDVLAPRPIASGASLVVAVPDGAPHGTLLRLARVDDLLGAARVTWGAEVLEGSDDSDAFAIESGQKSILLAWDDWDPKAGHSIVRTVAMMQGDVAKAPPPSVVSGEHDDAEAPALAPRPGGFWIAWIANAKRAPDHKEKHEAQDPAETAELEMGPRYLMVEPLDDGGKPAGAKVAATAKDGHVTGFDLGSARDGGLILTWRDDRAAPGTAGGSVRAALVRPDGAIEPRVVTDDDVGPGAPALVVDDAPAADASAWLTIANDADALRLVALDADGRPLDELAVEPNLGMASALAARSGRVVVSRPAGKGLEIQVMQCAKGNRPEGSATPN
ncbi:MAG TPA: hypothetical protein VHC69_12000 [Polyangiaceae bacterium]|nr:hypothetical protein [Polyangiaceae bacterium]